MYVDKNLSRSKKLQEIKSKEIKLIPIEKITDNPKNANRHSVEQIKRLEKLIEFQGFRNPLIVSNRSGFLVVGHGRKQAALNLGMKEIPVIYQDFDSEAQEYSYLISDNEVARWAELDFNSVYEELKTIEIEDLDVLGIENFSIVDPELIVDDDSGDDKESVDKFVIEVKFPNDMEMNDIKDDLIHRGYMVKVL